MDSWRHLCNLVQVLDDHFSLLLLLLVVVLLLVWLLPASMVVKLLFRMLLLMLIQVEFDSAKLLRVRLPTKWWFLQKGKQSLETETHKINKPSHIFQGFYLKYDSNMKSHS